MKKLIDRMRPQKEFEKVLKVRESDGRLFFKRFHEHFVRVKCPACGKGKGKLAFYRLGFRHVRCQDCSTLFCSPRPTEELLIKYYNHFSAPKLWTRLLVKTSVTRKAAQYEPRAQMILTWLREIKMRSGGVAVDYGCGSGAFAKCLQKTRFFKRVIGLDFSADCVRVARKHGIEADLRPLSDLASSSVDAIFTNDLIEHLYDPRSFLADCKRVLRKRGVLLIATPNGQGFDFKILSERAPNVAPPEHLNYFNPGSIKTLFDSHGFSVKKVETPGRLDLEIVKRAAARGFPVAKRNEYVAALLRTSDAAQARFQEFLAQNGLSSHMLVMAQRR